MTFLDVLVQLVDKRVQLLPLLGRKLQCIAGVDPLAQGAERERQSQKRERERVRGGSEVQEDRVTPEESSSPGADALSVGSHQSKEGAEAFRDKPLKNKHIFTS